MPRRGRLGGDASRGRSGWARARSPTNLGANASISAVSICARGGPLPRRAPHAAARRGPGGRHPPLRPRDAPGRARGTATFSVVDAMGLETARCRQTRTRGSFARRSSLRPRACATATARLRLVEEKRKRARRKKADDPDVAAGRKKRRRDQVCLNGSSAQIFRYFARSVIERTIDRIGKRFTLKRHRSPRLAVWRLGSR